MSRYERKTQISKTMGISFLLLLLALGTAGYTYSHWREPIYIQGTITTTTWEKACVRIMKVLNGSFTDPYTGQNFGTIDITDTVYDVIENTVEPINATPSKGTVDWYYNHTTGGEYVQNYLNWTIGTLAPNEQATLEIWIQTLPNPTGKYEPTSENQNIEINRGANITATSALGPLQAQTEGITLTIVDTDEPDDPYIAVITPTLPYFTPWAQDCRTSP